MLKVLKEWIDIDDLEWPGDEVADDEELFIKNGIMTVRPKAGSSGSFSICFISDSIETRDHDLCKIYLIPYFGMYYELEKRDWNDNHFPIQYGLDINQMYNFIKGCKTTCRGKSLPEIREYVQKSLHLIDADLLVLSPEGDRFETSISSGCYRGWVFSNYGSVCINSLVLCSNCEDKFGISVEDSYGVTVDIKDVSWPIIGQISTDNDDPLVPSKRISDLVFDVKALIDGNLTYSFKIPESVKWIEEKNESLKEWIDINDLEWPTDSAKFYCVVHYTCEYFVYPSYRFKKYIEAYTGEDSSDFGFDDDTVDISYVKDLLNSNDLDPSITRIIPINDSYRREFIEELRRQGIIEGCTVTKKTIPMVQGVTKDGAISVANIPASYALKRFFNHCFSEKIYDNKVITEGVMPQPIDESLILREAAQSNGVYSLKTGWLKEPKKEDIPDDIDLEPELSDLVNKYNQCKTINDIDNYIDNLYILRQKGLLSGGEYSKENQLFKEIRSMGYLDDLKQKKIDLENEEMSLK